MVVYDRCQAWLRIARLSSCTHRTTFRQSHSAHGFCNSTSFQSGAQLAALHHGDEADCWPPPTVSLAVPTFMVWGADTGVGKTLVSAALAAAAARASVRTPPLHSRDVVYSWQQQLLGVWPSSLFSYSS